MLTKIHARIKASKFLQYEQKTCGDERLIDLPPLQWTFKGFYLVLGLKENIYLLLL